MNGLSVPCSPSIVAPTGGCKKCRITAFPGEYPSDLLCMSPQDYLSAHFDPDVVGPPGTCWLFTAADVALACGGLPFIVPWWLVFVEAAGFYVWRVPLRWIRANVIGDLGAAEHWVHALSLNAGSDTSWVNSTALHDIAITVAAAFDDFMVAMAAHFTDVPIYREVGCSLLEQTSVGGDIDTILVSEFAPINGTSGRTGTNNSHTLPFETSMAISWETGVRGRRGRGRTYLPPLAVDQLGSDARWTDAVCEAVANYAVETLIPALNGGGDTWQLAVRSGKDMALYNVTGARVSNVPDAQRRRRRSQVPDYFEGA